MNKYLRSMFSEVSSNQVTLIFHYPMNKIMTLVAFVNVIHHV